MNLSYKKLGEIHHPINIIELSDNSFVCLYQGNRGHNPKLDYIVKYKTKKTRLRTPTHTHWIIDLLLKCEHNSKDVNLFISDWLEIYEKEKPFTSIEEINNYKIINSNTFIQKYKSLENLGQFSIEFMSILIELFIKCEKQTPNAFMFKNLLTMVKDYTEDNKDFYQVVSYSKRV